jgi:hypothetical protein
MKVGIDGTMWYCSNGRDLPDPRGQFTFEPTLREAAEAFKSEFGGDGVHGLPLRLKAFLDHTPAQFAAAPAAPCLTTP